MYDSHRIRRRQPVRCDREYLSTRLSTIVNARITQVKHTLDVSSPLQVPARVHPLRVCWKTNFILCRVLHYYIASYIYNAKRLFAEIPLFDVEEETIRRKMHQSLNTRIKIECAEVEYSRTEQVV